MKKLFTLMSIFTLLMSFTFLNCNHIHNDDCGYNKETQTGCTHKHDGSCYTVDPLDITDPDKPPF